VAGRGMARRGAAGQGRAWHGPARLGAARRGKVWHGMVFILKVRAWRGAARRGTARHGKAWHGAARHGKARHGMVFILKVGARQGLARQGRARRGLARQGRAWFLSSRSRQGQARLGKARPGAARLGKARQGVAGHVGAYSFTRHGEAAISGTCGVYRDLRGTSGGGTVGIKYQEHSATSFDAAIEIESDADTLRGRVLRCILGSGGGLTDEEMQSMMNLNPSTQRPRRVELVERGLVRDSGFQRKTRSGRNAVVWEISGPKSAGQKRQMFMFDD